MARERAGPSSILVRPRAPVRGRTTPRYRPRRAGGSRRASARAGRRDVRRDGPDGRQDALDRDAVWLYGDTGAPRLDRRGARRVRRGGSRRRDRRPDRRRRSRRAVRLLRAAHDGGGTGLRRSTHVLAGAARRGPSAGAAARARPRRGSGGRAVTARCRAVRGGSCAAGACSRAARTKGRCVSRDSGRADRGGTRHVRHRAFCCSARAGEGEAARVEARAEAARVARRGHDAACGPARRGARACRHAEGARSRPGARFASPAAAKREGRARSRYATGSRARARAALANAVDRRPRDGSRHSVRLRVARRDPARSQTYHGWW